MKGEGVGLSVAPPDGLEPSTNGLTASAYEALSLNSPLLYLLSYGGFPVTAPFKKAEIVLGVFKR